MSGRNCELPHQEGAERWVIKLYMRRSRQCYRLFEQIHEYEMKEYAS